MPYLCVFSVIALSFNKNNNKNKLKTHRHTPTSFCPHTSRTLVWMECDAKVSRSKNTGHFSAFPAAAGHFVLGLVWAESAEITFTSLQVFYKCNFVIQASRLKTNRTHKACLCLPLQSFVADILVRIDVCLNCRTNGNGAERGEPVRTQRGELLWQNPAQVGESISGC